MGNSLRSPPLVEAICKFDFLPLGSDSWDLTIPGRLYGLVKDEFPLKSQIRDIGVQFNLSTNDKPEMSQSLKETDRVQLIRSDKSAMIQISPNVLVINQLKSYNSWVFFSSLISNIFNKYIEVIENSSLKRIGLRYINHIPINHDRFEIPNIISIFPVLSKSLDKDICFFHQRYDLIHKNSDHSGVLIHQTAIIQNQSQNPEYFIALDLDFNSNEVQKYSDIEQIKSWLNYAHESIKSSFKDSLNPDFLNQIN